MRQFFVPALAIAGLLATSTALTGFRAVHYGLNANLYSANESAGLEQVARGEGANPYRTADGGDYVSANDRISA